MIEFTMKILNYHDGTYTVEYIPEVSSCKPVKLNIQLDEFTLQNKDVILERLKLSSPQEYWYQQANSGNLEEKEKIAKSLVNTDHKVKDGIQFVVDQQLFTQSSFEQTPRQSYRGPARLQPRPNVTQNNTAPQLNTVSSVVGQSSPEQTASFEDRNMVRLKILIQQVIQEMAEGTV